MTASSSKILAHKNTAIRETFIEYENFPIQTLYTPIFFNTKVSLNTVARDFGM